MVNPFKILFFCLESHSTPLLTTFTYCAIDHLESFNLSDYTAVPLELSLPIPTAFYSPWLLVTTLNLNGISFGKFRRLDHVIFAFCAWCILLC